MIFYYIVIALVLDYIVEYILFQRFNQTPLDLQTIEGTGQAYHPSVFFFKKPWNGFSFWMVETPYPMGVQPYKDRWECPSIHVSNDGVHWSQPEGLKNPIDDLTEEEIRERDFFSDPHLVYKDGKIECFYRFSQRLDTGFHTWLLRRSSSDGTHWSERETLLDFYDEECKVTVGDMVRSPAIIYMNGKYSMWYVDNVNPKGEKHVCYSESADGIAWTPKTICLLIGKECEPWHLDLAYLNNKYILTIYDFHNLTVWEGECPTEFRYIKTVLSPSYKYGSFYSDGLYRSSLIFDGQIYKMYFSAYDNKNTHIGVMEGTSIENLRIKSIHGNHISMRGFIKPFFMLWKIRVWKLIHSSK